MKLPLTMGSRHSVEMRQSLDKSKLMEHDFGTAAVSLNSQIADDVTRLLHSSRVDALASYFGPGPRQARIRT